MRAWILVVAGLGLAALASSGGDDGDGADQPDAGPAADHVLATPRDISDAP